MADSSPFAEADATKKRPLTPERGNSIAAAKILAGNSPACFHGTTMTGTQTSSRVVHVSFTDALAKGPPPAGNLAVPIFSRGSLAVELYSPVGHDSQKPHSRDEIYFIAQGNGRFFDGERRQSVAASSFLFVPAGQVHRFEDFSPDFVVWVVFYGPEGGEVDV